MTRSTVPMLSDAEALLSFQAESGVFRCPVPNDAGVWSELEATLDARLGRLGRTSSAVADAVTFELVGARHGFDIAREGASSEHAETARALLQAYTYCIEVAETLAAANDDAAVQAAATRLVADYESSVSPSFDVLDEDAGEDGFAGIHAIHHALARIVGALGRAA